MGSFWGHVDEAIFFLTLATWWLFNISVEYIRKEGHTGDIHLPLAFELPWKKHRHIPVEIFFKTGFPLFGFIAELVDRDYANFLDENGQFVDLVNLHHMGIYFLFVLHGLTDLALWCGWPMVRNANLLTVGGAFFWYGIAFYFHSHMPGKEPLEAMVHLVSIPAILLCGLSAILLISHTRGVTIRLALTYGVFTLGTWFMHAPYMLYKPSPFPGHEPSGWDRSDPRNSAFVVGMFGGHLCLNVVIMGVIYVIIYCVMTRGGWASTFSLPYKTTDPTSYQKLPIADDVETCLSESSYSYSHKSMVVD